MTSEISARWPNDPHEQFDRAFNLHQSGRLDDAETIYRQILEQCPDHAESTHYLGILLHQAGKSDEGISLVTKSLALAPDEALWPNDLGNMLATLNRDEEAILAFMEALDRNRHNAVVWNNLGAVLSRAEQLDNAALSLENAIAIAPNFEDARINLGDVYSKLGRNADAVSQYCRAYVLNPSDEKPKQMLGIAYYALERFDEAAEAFGIWLIQEPDNPIPRHLLAACSGISVPERATDEYIEAIFDKLAETFDDKLVRSLSYTIPAEIRDVLDGLSLPFGALHILDAGCGTGLCGRYLSKYSVRLTGVDLSRKSLNVAAGKGDYDQLVHSELLNYLESTTSQFDLIVVADTLIYFGSLEEVFLASRRALHFDGMLLASFEARDPINGDYGITPSGRYSHSQEYVISGLKKAGFELRFCRPTGIRTELGKPVNGFLVVAVKKHGHA